MDKYAMVPIFLAGVISGILLVGLLVLYLLSGSGHTSKPPPPDQPPTSPPVVVKDHREEQRAQEEQEALESVLNTLRLVSAKAASNTPRVQTDGGVDPDGDVVSEFSTLSQDAIERQRQTKLLCALLTDFSKLHSGFAKEMLRLSQVAEGYVRTDKPIDKWWNSFSIALDHLAQDHDGVSTSICPGFTTDLSRIEQEHVIKNLWTQGSKCVAKLKDATTQYDTKYKELMKLKEKAVGGGSMSVGEHSKIVMKMDVCETALKAAKENLSTVQAELNQNMPSVINDYNLIASSATDSLISILMKLTDTLVSAQTKTTHILNRLKLDMASTASRVIDKNSTNPLVLEILEKIEQGNAPTRIDMTTESIAAMASSLLPAYASLPPQVGRCIGEETCVWLNAFAGRMYRDAARSDYFHNWFCTKAGILLNKGKRPDFVDMYHVSDVVFGASPPSIRNITWLPHCPLLSGQKHDPEHNIACSADICFRSGISFTVSTKLWINWPRERYAFVPVKMKIEVLEVIGKVHFGVQKRASFLSFIEEPYTRFAVKSEVGGDYKLTDIPRVSNMLIAKLKKYIKNKVCYPKAYKTRILWPKKWWPEGPDEYKESASSAPKTEDPPVGETTAPAKSDVTDGVTCKAVEQSKDAEQSKEKKSGDALNCEVAEEKEKAVSGGAGLLSSTRQNLSKWIIKPLLQGKKGRSRKNWHNNDSDDSDGDSSENNLSAVALLLAPYRTDLIETEKMWDGCIRQAFFHKSTDGEIVLDVTPPVIAALETNKARSGIGHAISHSNLKANVQRSVNSGKTGTLTSKCQSIDPADTLPLSAQNIIYACRNNVIAREARNSLRTRSYSISDLRSESLAVTAYYYFNCGRSGNCHSVLHGSVGDSAEHSDHNDHSARHTRRDHISKLSSNLTMRFASAGALLHRHRMGKRKDADHHQVGSSRPNTKIRYQNDGFILNTFPRREDISQVPAAALSGGLNDASKGNITNFFGFGRQLEKAKDVLKTGLRRPDARNSQYDALNTIGSPTMESPSLTDSKDMEKVESPISKFDKVGSPDGSVKITLPSALNSCVGGVNPSPVSSVACTSRQSPVISVDLEKEAESLAWQARAQAITEASSNGEFPSMQGFLLMKQNLPSCKKWVVLRQGNIGVFTSPADNTRFGAPLTHVNLLGAICRPAGKSSCFEVGIPMEHAPVDKDSKISASGQTAPVSSPAVSFYWMPFWADSDVQCRAWIMAVQQSAHQLQDEKAKKEARKKGMATLH